MFDNKERLRFGLPRRTFIPLFSGVLGGLIIGTGSGFAGLQDQAGPESYSKVNPLRRRKEAPEHSTNRNKVVDLCLNDALKEKYGVVYPQYEEQIELDDGSYIIRSLIWLYSRNTRPPIIVEDKYSAGGQLTRSVLVIDLRYTGGAYYIPELTHLMTPFAREPVQLLEVDFDEALQSAFNLPEFLTEQDPSRNLDRGREKEWVGQSDGNKLTFSVNRWGYLKATIEHTS